MQMTKKLIINESKESLEACLQKEDNVHALSGLKVKEKKTEALWIGSKTGSSEVLLAQRNFKSPKHKAKALGVWFSVKPEEMITLNYEEKVEEIKNLLSCWSYRRLTLFGKIAVLKSLVASQLVYVLSPLPLNENPITEVNKLFYTFLWNGKGDKIKRDTMIGNYNKGGLKVIDIPSFSKSLKAI